MLSSQRPFAAHRALRVENPVLATTPTLNGRLTATQQPRTRLHRTRDQRLTSLRIEPCATSLLPDIDRVGQLVHDCLHEGNDVLVRRVRSRCTEMPTITPRELD